MIAVFGVLLIALFLIGLVALRIQKNYAYDGVNRKVADLGEGYYLFSLVDAVNSHELYLFCPTGEIFWLEIPGGYWDPDFNISFNFGAMSEKVFSLMYEKSQYGFRARAFYFNAIGENIIDLSEEITNFEVTELGAFSNGKAEIKFTGADSKKYMATINTAGEFVGKPHIVNKKTEY